MSSQTTYFLNTGGVEYSAEELEAVLTQGDSLHQYGSDKPQRYSDGEGWEGWGELDYGDHFVQVDGVDHKLTIVSYNSGGYDGSPRHLVFELEGKLFMVEGFYHSYGEDTWEPLREVQKVTKTVEVYE